MTNEQKMLMGKVYDSSDPVLVEKRCKAHRLSKEYNDTFEDEKEKRSEILAKLLPNMGEGTYIQGPIQFDYGDYTTIGENCFFNFNLVVMDCGPVKIGNDVFFGPNCTLAVPMHPLIADERRKKSKTHPEEHDLEFGRGITIGDDCWIASDVTICGGVTIGNGTVIGAGSVVTKDIPDGVLAAGNPCKVIRKITEQDSIFNKKELFD